VNWVDWEGIGDDGRALIEFVRKLIVMRRTFPVLRRSRFFTGALNEELGVKDVTWLSPLATEMTPEQWQDAKAKCLGVMLDGRAQATGIRRPASDATLLLVVNSYHDVVVFKLPDVAGGARWELLIDTNQPEQTDTMPFAFGHEYQVTGRSLLLFALKSEMPRGILSRARDALKSLAAKRLEAPPVAEEESPPSEAEPQEVEPVS
jgi:isoamylase